MYSYICSYIHILIGTFITEWEEGAKKCHEMFISLQSSEIIATKLTEIAVMYKLDGWLINIENTLIINQVTQSAVDGSMKFKCNLVSNMKHFLRKLSEYMHKARPDSTVIWYTCTYTDIHLLMHTYIHTYIHAYLHVLILICTHICTCSGMIL